MVALGIVSNLKLIGVLGKFTQSPGWHSIRSKLES